MRNKFYKLKSWMRMKLKLKKKISQIIWNKINNNQNNKDQQIWKIIIKIERLWN